MLKPTDGIRWHFMNAGLLLSLALLAGRVAGFAREMVLASSLGLSADADVAIMLLTLPDLLVNLLLSGGLGIALIPALRNAMNKYAGTLFLQASTAVMTLFSVIGLTVALAPAWWLAAMAPGIQVPETLKTSGALFALAFALPLTALSGVTTSALNAANQFFVAGCGTLIFNLCIIGALLSVNSFDQILPTLCWAILLGATLRWFSQLIAMPSAYWQRPERTLLLNSHLLKAFVTGLMATSLLVVAPVVVRSLVSLLGEGQIAAFNYASKLVELPLGIFITTLATVAYPRLCELFAEDQSTIAMQELQATLQRAVVLSISVVMPAIWFGDSVVLLLFLRGKITDEAVRAITELMQVIILTVPFVGVSSLAATALNARGQTLTLLKITFFCLVLLPLLCMPGVFLSSGVMLMWGMVAFHFVYALMLARFAGVAWFGQRGWLNRKVIISILFVIAMSLIFAMADHFSGDLLPVVRVGMASLTFILAAGGGLRMLNNKRMVGDVL